MKPYLEITQELRDKLRKRYGNIVDHIGMRQFKDSNDYEMSVIFYNRFRRNRIPCPISDQLIVENSMHNLCDLIDEIVFDREPNMDITPQFSPIPYTNIRVSDKIPEGMIFISPKTYQKIISNLHYQNL